MERHHRALEHMYHTANVNELFHNRLVVESGKATLTWQVDERFFHAAGSLHGAAYFKLLDDSAFFACASLEAEHFLLTSHFSLEFLRKVKGGILTAIGTMTRQTESGWEGHSQLWDEGGKLVAQGSGTFATSKILLVSVEAYREGFER